MLRIITSYRSCNYGFPNMYYYSPFFNDTVSWKWYTVSVDDKRNMCMGQWHNDSFGEETEVLEKNMPQCHLYCYKFQYLTMPMEYKISWRNCTADIRIRKSYGMWRCVLFPVFWRISASSSSGTSSPILAWFPSPLSRRWYLNSSGSGNPLGTGSLDPLRWVWYIVLKCRYDNTTIHCVISQKSAELNATILALLGPGTD